MNKVKNTLIALSFLFLVEQGISKEVLTHVYAPETAGDFSPWFTGPLLSPSSRTMPKGHVNIEPYLNFFAFNGSYTQTWGHISSPHFYSSNLYIPISVGINSFFDIGATVQSFYQSTQGQSSTQFGDIPFGIGLQLLAPPQNSYFPFIKP